MVTSLRTLDVQFSVTNVLWNHKARGGLKGGLSACCVQWRCSLGLEMHFKYIKMIKKKTFLRPKSSYRPLPESFQCPWANRVAQTRFIATYLRLKGWAVMPLLHSGLCPEDRPQNEDNWITYLLSPSPNQHGP